MKSRDAIMMAKISKKCKNQGHGCNNQNFLKTKERDHDD